MEVLASDWDLMGAGTYSARFERRKRSFLWGTEGSD